MVIFGAVFTRDATMRFGRLFGATAIALAAATGASAQPDASAASAAGNGVIHLHMPGAQTGSGIIHLHPIHHAANPARDAGANAAPNIAPEALPPPAGKNSVPPAPKAAAHGTPAQGGKASGKTTIPFNFGDDETTPAPGSGGDLRAPQPAGNTASIPPHAATSSKTPDTEHAGLTKRGAVMFDKGSTSPSPAQFGGVKLLAGDLTTALESGASRIQLEAYGGAPGDKSSDARRLSLRRALAVRQLLIDNGVPSNRIDVRAMGGADDKGPTDRVDIFVRAG
jgi:outer membrane protein OmpA-like peptidoglycan-associated protein